MRRAVIPSLLVAWSLQAKGAASGAADVVGPVICDRYVASINASGEPPAWSDPRRAERRFEDGSALSYPAELVSVQLDVRTDNLVDECEWGGVTAFYKVDNPSEKNDAGELVERSGVSICLRKMPDGPSGRAESRQAQANRQRELSRLRAIATEGKAPSYLEPVIPGDTSHPLWLNVCHQLKRRAPTDSCQSGLLVWDFWELRDLGDPVNEEFLPGERGGFSYCE